MAIYAWPKPSPLGLSNKPWSKREDIKILFASKYFVYAFLSTPQNKTHKCCSCLSSVYWAIKIDISWNNMAMDNRSVPAFIETNRTRTNSVIICLPSKGAGREKRQKQCHLRCIAAPPQARAAARKKYISSAI